MKELKKSENKIDQISDNYVKKNFESLADGEVLFVPTVNFRGKEGYTYPEGTIDLFRFLEEEYNQNVKLAFDNYYNENVMHSDWIRLVDIAVTHITLPIVLGVISNYIFNKIILKKKDPEIIKVAFSIKVKKGSKTIDFNYDGAASKLDQAMKNIEGIVNDDRENKK